MKKKIILLLLIIGVVFASIPVYAAPKAGCENVPLGEVKYQAGIPNDNQTYQDPAYYLDTALNIMRYVGVILCIGLSMADFLKTLLSDDKDGYKKVVSKSLKRLIYAALIFFLPTIVENLLKYLGVLSINGTCGIGK